MDENALRKAFVNAAWGEVFYNVDDVDDLYNRWFQCFHSILESFVPHRMAIIRPRDKPWINSEIRIAIRKRNRSLKLFCRRKSPRTWENYRLQRNTTTSLIRNRKLSSLANLNKKLKDPKLGPKK